MAASPAVPCILGRNTQPFGLCSQVEVGIVFRRLVTGFQSVHDPAFSVVTRAIVCRAVLAG